MRLIQENFFDNRHTGDSIDNTTYPLNELEKEDGICDLETLKTKVLKCNRCDLRKGCRGVVFGEGNPSALLMLVGEGPGGVEDELGRPFVGPAGQLLDKILQAVDISREEVYIGNVIKCRPPGNRFPASGEVEACYPHLESQIRLINPRIIVCLGALATQTIIDGSARITKIRGEWREIDGRRVIPTYHPAALLRDSSKKRPVWEDFKRIKIEYEIAKRG